MPPVIPQQIVTLEQSAPRLPAGTSERAAPRSDDATARRSAEASPSSTAEGSASAPTPSQESRPQGPPDGSAAPVRPEAVPTGVSGIAPAETEAARFARLDTFLEQGQTSTFPGSQETILQDAGGFRSWLGDRRLGLRVVASVSGLVDFLPTGQPRDPQRFNGQRPTLQLASQNAELTWRMDSLGLPDTQFSFGLNNTFTSYDANGPNSLYVRNLALYQTFLNGRITVKAGLTPNNYEYVGFYVGGSPILAAGISSLLPIQAGLAADPANPPLVNVTFYGARDTYLRVGVQRSVSPLGLNEEVYRRDGPLDIDFHRDGAGAAYIGEAGIRRSAAPGVRQMWLRVGGLYNQSDYTRFDGGGTRSNAAFWALADRQITQPHGDAPGRGLYVGASAFWIPPQVNVSNVSFEGRVYAVGPIASRPRDTASLRVTWTKFSDDAQEANEARGVIVHDQQFNVTASYSARVARGVYAVPALTYLRNPSFVGDFDDALIGAVQIVTLF